jgi:hypothetical protein
MINKIPIRKAIFEVIINNNLLLSKNKIKQNKIQSALGFHLFATKQ